MRKNIRVEAGFELATFRLRKGIQQEIAASEREVAVRNLYSIPGELDTTDTHTPTPEVPRRTSLVRNLRRPWAPREHPRESTEKSTTDPPCVVTPAMCRQLGHAILCIRASGGEAQSLWSDTGVVLSLVSEGGLKLRIFYFSSSSSSTSTCSHASWRLLYT